jgi:hypothetical protein
VTAAECLRRAANRMPGSVAIVSSEENPARIASASQRARIARPIPWRACAGSTKKALILAGSDFGSSQDSSRSARAFRPRNVSHREGAPYQRRRLPAVPLRLAPACSQRPRVRVSTARSSHAVPQRPPASRVAIHIACVRLWLNADRMLTGESVTPRRSRRTRCGGTFSSVRTSRIGGRTRTRR